MKKFLYLLVVSLAFALPLTLIWHREAITNLVFGYVMSESEFDVEVKTTNAHYIYLLERVDKEEQPRVWRDREAALRKVYAEYGRAYPTPVEETGTSR